MTVFRRGMTDAAFEEWAASLLVIGEEAFLPEEVDGTVSMPSCKPPIQTCERCGREYVRSTYRQHVLDHHSSRRPVQTCRLCGRQYVRASYSDHVDAYHTDGARTAYWRERARRKRAAA